MHQKSLNVKLKVLGPDHPHVSDTKRRCAHLFFLNSIFDGPNAAFWHAGFCSIALILKQQAKYSQAIKLCYESLAVYEKCHGQDHARVLDTKTLIAHLQEHQAASAARKAIEEAQQRCDQLQHQLAAAVKAKDEAEAEGAARAGASAEHATVLQRKLDEQDAAAPLNLYLI